MNIVFMSTLSVNMDGYDPACPTPKEVNGHALPEKITYLDKTDEMELKIMVPDISFFDKIQDLFLNGIISTNPQTWVLNDNRLHKDGFLFSASIDTVGSDGTPTRKIHKSGYQLRERTSWIPFDDQTGEGGHWSGSEMTIKSLLSQGDTIQRLELEADIPVIGQGFDCFKEAIGEKLPEDFPDITSDDLAVASMVATSRSSYFIIHYMPEYDVYVTYEVCNDKNVSLLPQDLTPLDLGRNYEIELEAKCVRGYHPAIETREGLLDIVAQSGDILKQEILSLSPKLHLAQHSKTERADIAVGKYYYREYTDDVEALSDRLGLSPKTDAPTQGIFYSLFKRMSLVEAFGQKEAAHNLARIMLPAAKLVKTPDLSELYRSKQAPKVN